MSPRFRASAEERAGGLSHLLRTLFSGIPWSEASERVDVVCEKLGPGQAVRIHNSNGRIHVTGEERDDVEVRARKRGRAESPEAAARLLDEIVVEATRETAGLSLDVQIPKRWNRRGSVNLEVRVPRTARVAIEAVNGKLRVEGLRSAVRAHSSNGPVTVDDVVGDIEVYTSNGTVSCSDTCCVAGSRSAASPPRKRPRCWSISLPPGGRTRVRCWPSSSGKSERKRRPWRTYVTFWPSCASPSAPTSASTARPSA